MLPGSVICHTACALRCTHTTACKLRCIDADLYAVFNMEGDNEDNSEDDEDLSLSDNEHASLDFTDSFQWRKNGWHCSSISSSRDACQVPISPELGESGNVTNSQISTEALDRTEFTKKPGANLIGSIMLGTHNTQHNATQHSTTQHYTTLHYTTYTTQNTTHYTT